MKEELQTTHILSIVSTFYQIYILNRLINYDNCMKLIQSTTVYWIKSRLAMAYYRMPIL